MLILNISFGRGTSYVNGKCLGKKKAEYPSQSEEEIAMQKPRDVPRITNFARN